MKLKFITPFLIAALGVVTLNACDKDDDTTPTPKGGSAFSVTADGTTFATDTANFDVSNNTMQIWASKFSYTKTMIININGVTPGTYTLSNQFPAIFTQKTGPGLFDFETFSATSGTIVVTSADTANNLQGTFSFTGYNVSNANDSVVFSNGSFNLERE